MLYKKAGIEAALTVSFLTDEDEKKAAPRSGFVVEATEDQLTVT